MRKLFLLVAAVCCLVMNAWADCQLIGNEIPSGTGVNARSIINIQYDKKTHILSFEDIYEPTFTAYERSYQVYFYEYSPDYAFYQNLSGSGNNPVFYGDGCNSDAFIPRNGSTGSSDPGAHFWVTCYFVDCAGGVISIDLSEVVYILTTWGYNHVMVGIRPSYRISSSASAVYYSTYGDWHSWLMNTAHFRIDPWVDRIAGLVTEVHTPTGVIDNTGWGSPFEAPDHVYLCEGQDTANVHANIFPTSDVTGSVSYFWQSRTDDETVWKMKGSKSSFSKTAWNNAVSAKKPLYADRNFFFSVGDMERVTYFRLALVYDYDTLYSEEIQIDAKSRIKITGPVACKLGDEAWKNINIKGAYPIFDTLTYEVDKSDTIRLKPYNSNSSFAETYCSIPTGGSITTDSEGNPCITDIWYSCSIAISGETHSVKLYVDGTLYHSFNKVPCSFRIKECNYPAPADPTKSGADFLCWRPRDGSSTAQMSYITNHAVIGDEEWDAVFDEKYALYVEGTQVTSINKYTIAPGVTYNSERKELTLTNANLSDDNGDVIAVYQDLVINCVGTNTITTNSDYYICILEDDEDGGDVTITGSGSLSLSSDGFYAIYTADALTISGGCTVTAQSANRSAVRLSGEPLTVDGATLIAKGNGKEATIYGCNELIMLNGVAIRTAHTYDAATHKFLDAAGNEAKDDIIIGVEGTGLEGLTMDNAQCTMRKMIIDNQLYILRGDKLFDAVGREMR